MSKPPAKRARLAAAKVSVPSEADGTFTLAVPLTKKQLEGSVLCLAEEAEGSYVYAWETCAICLEPVKGFCEGVYLSCKKHCFNGRCIVPHLQRDHRCPVCRHAPREKEEPQYETFNEQEAADILYSNFEHAFLERIMMCIGLIAADGSPTPATMLARRFALMTEGVPLSLQPFATPSDVENLRTILAAVHMQVSVRWNGRWNTDGVLYAS